MFSNVFRFARPAARLNVWSKQPTTASSRAFSLSASRKSGHPSPQLLGEGGKSGEVPTDINQSTGLERFQTLGFLEGIDVFDHQPLDSTRIGTLANPVLVYSLVRFFSLGSLLPSIVFRVRWLTLFEGRGARYGMYRLSCGFS